MAYRGKRDSADGLITARLAAVASRRAGEQPLNVEAALAELREVAGDRTDLLAEVAGRGLGQAIAFANTGRISWANWPTGAVEAALLIAAGADVSRLAEWVEIGQRRA